MKKLVIYLFLILFISACEEKSQFDPPIPYKIKKPKADFTSVIGENGNIVINFTVNKGDAFVLDYGDGKAKKDTMAGTLKTLSATVYHAYEKNGLYKVSLNITNPKGKSRKEQFLLIGNVLPPPVADFKYELKEGGILEFKNLSQNTSTYHWRIIRKGDHIGYNSKTENPAFILEGNGLYYVNFQATNKYNKHQTIKDSVNITHARPISNPTFKGIFFDKNGSLAGEGRNTFEESYGRLMVYGSFCNSFYMKDIGNVFILTGRPVFPTLQEKYDFLKKQLVIGSIKKSGWQTLIRKGKPVWEKETGVNDAFNIKDDPDSLLEIIEVTEVDQLKLTPEMFDKAFQVTFRIKVDLGIQGKIDGTFKMKYMIY